MMFATDIHRQLIHAQTTSGIFPNNILHCDIDLSSVVNLLPEVPSPTTH